MKTALLFSASVLLAFASSVSGGWFSSPSEDWNSFRVKVISFKWMPRTESEASGNGWVRETSECNPSNDREFVGKRYVKGDIPIAVLFTNGGRLAGMQIRLPRAQPQTGEMGRAFINDDEFKTVTAYFIDPADICTDRAAAAPDKLVFQLGPYSRRNFIEPPMQEANIEQFLSENNWVEGECNAYMGKHYWPAMGDHAGRGRDLCDRTKPFFIMYNTAGRLTNFGWMFYGDYESDYFERPSISAAERTMITVPRCLRDSRLTGKMRTMHVYLRPTSYWPGGWCN